MSRKKLSAPMLALLREIAEAGDAGMVVPGTKGTTARALRDGGLVAYAAADGASKKPIPQRVTPDGKDMLNHHGMLAMAVADMPPLPKEVDEAIEAVLDAQDDDIHDGGRTTGDAVTRLEIAIRRALATAAQGGTQT